MRAMPIRVVLLSRSAQGVQLFHATLECRMHIGRRALVKPGVGDGAICPAPSSTGHIGEGTEHAECRGPLLFCNFLADMRSMLRTSSMSANLGKARAATRSLICYP